MNRIVCLALLFSFLSCKTQEKETVSFNLPISPVVDSTHIENQEIISVVKKFLMTKNQSLLENKYWLKSDFEKYIYPYADIYRLEYGKDNDYVYKPILMELVSIDDEQKLLKIGFVRYNLETNESLIRAIYNIIAIKGKDDSWRLKRAIDYQTHDWSKQKENSLMYILPKWKSVNENEVRRQAQDIENICGFFNCQPIEITYYSCDNPKQLFEVKGFDYLPNMYFSKTGGMADYGNIIYSGNNSEYYTHEIVHIYLKKMFPNISKILDEGVATYIGGSGTYDYEWHRKKMTEHLSTATINLSEHFNPYERLYIDNETPIPYMIGALICERTNRMYGKEKLFELLNSEKEIWDALSEVGLTKENLTTELKEELSQTPMPYSKL